MSSSVTTAPQVSVWAALRARLDEASTWAGIGGILLAALSLLPAALPAFHQAFGQHGWARMLGLTVALLTFVVAIAKKEGNATVAEIAQAAVTVLASGKCGRDPG